MIKGQSLELLNSLFEYLPQTGQLKRKTRRSANADKGDIVGTTDGKGYLHVSVNKKFLLIHQIIFYMHHHYLPSEIDHIDRDKKNNRIENLRPAERKQNAANTFQKNNTSGYKGVSLNSESQQFHAQIKIKGKQTYLGRFCTALEAARAYDQAAIAHFGKDYAWLNNA